MFYEDNEGARHKLMDGFSGDGAAALLLGAFWGASAIQRSRPWIDRVCSADNPADCLTKPGCSRAHLAGAIWEDADLQPLWHFLIEAFSKGGFPPWGSFEELFAPRLQ